MFWKIQIINFSEINVDKIPVHQLKMAADLKANLFIGPQNSV